MQYSLMVVYWSEDGHRDKGLKDIHCGCFVNRGRQEVPLGNSVRVECEFVRVFVCIDMSKGVNIHMSGSVIYGNK